MNIENLKYFIRVVDQKSITKAAQDEHLTQSAMTQIIKKLEDEFSCGLLERSNKGIEATECGQLVYEYAKTMLNSYDSMKSRLACMTEGCYSIIIKPCCSMDNYILPKALFKIQNEYKNIKVDVMIEQKPQIINEIKIGITDFGFVMGDTPVEKTLDIDIVGNEQIVLVAGNQTPIENPMLFCDIEKYKFIDFSLGSYGDEVRKRIKEQVRKDLSPMNLTPFFAIDSITAIKSLVESNFGIAFLPYFTVKHDVEQGKFKMITIKEFALDLPIKIISKKDAQLSPLVVSLKKSLIDTSRKLFKEM